MKRPTSRAHKSTPLSTDVLATVVGGGLVDNENIKTWVVEDPESGVLWRPDNENLS